MSNDSTLTVFGSFGYGNLGDELVPGCFERLLAAAGHEGPVPALSRFGKIEPGRSAPYPDAQARADMGDQVLVLAGGGIIEPRPMSCMNRAFALADDVPGVQVAAHGISVEPGVAFSWRQRRALQRQLERIGTVFVRDSLSAETLGSLIPGQKIRVIGDIALWMQGDEIPAEIDALVPAGAIPVILGDTWETDDFYDWMTAELAALAREMKAPLMMLPFAHDFGEDMKIHRRMRDQLAQTAPDVEVAFPLEKVPFEQFTPGVVAALLERAPLTVSMRLHGCVVSYAMKTPFLALAYHPKLRGFAQTVGRTDALIPAQLPSRQSEGTYGFSFADLECEAGALCAAAKRVLADEDFSAIPYFQRQQVMAIRETIARFT